MDIVERYCCFVLFFRNYRYHLISSDFMKSFDGKSLLKRTFYCRNFCHLPFYPNGVLNNQRLCAIDLNLIRNFHAFYHRDETDAEPVTYTRMI